MFLLLLHIICFAAVRKPVPCAVVRDHDLKARTRVPRVYLDVIDWVMVAKRLCRHVV
jgi:hypothetical protein